MNADITKIVRNRSSRASGSKISLIVLHTTEGHNRPGLSDLQGLGDWFDNPAAQASSHVANDAEGHDARYVWDSQKAWTQSGYNSVSLSIEQIGFASTSRDDWYKNAHPQLVNTARWIAFWSAKYQIPIRRAWTIGGGVQRSGVATHKQLGVTGGGHHDPGAAYPMNYVLWLARWYKCNSHGRSNSVQGKRAKNKVNRIRKHYGIALIK